MADPQKLIILKALTEWLEGIQHVEPDPGSGIVGADWRGFNLQGAVFRGLSVYGEQEALPMLSILESPRPDVPVYAGENREARAEDWVLLLQGWVKDDKRNPTDPAYMLADVVERRLGQLIATDPQSGFAIDPANYLLGRRLTKLEISPYVVRPPTEGISAKAFFYMPLKLGVASVVG